MLAGEKYKEKWSREERKAIGTLYLEPPPLDDAGEKPRHPWVQRSREQDREEGVKCSDATGGFRRSTTIRAKRRIYCCCRAPATNRMSCKPQTEMEKRHARIGIHTRTTTHAGSRAWFQCSLERVLNREFGNTVPAALRKHSEIEVMAERKKELLARTGRLKSKNCCPWNWIDDMVKRPPKRTGVAWTLILWSSLSVVHEKLSPAADLPDTFNATLSNVHPRVVAFQHGSCVAFSFLTAYGNGCWASSVGLLALVSRHHTDKTNGAGVETVNRVGRCVVREIGTLPCPCALELRSAHAIRLRAQRSPFTQSTAPAMRYAPHRRRAVTLRRRRLEGAETFVALSLRFFAPVIRAPRSIQAPRPCDRCGGTLIGLARDVVNPTAGGRREPGCARVITRARAARMAAYFRANHPELNVFEPISSPETSICSGDFRVASIQPKLLNEKHSLAPAAQLIFDKYSFFVTIYLAPEEKAWCL
ncbi:hypothetical protein C8R45DRAFT_941008 [Mycena sanguinolenta]|nr:hypothetical protein C8R45DRAFT_941008 [Mycena sanguinolenta]